MGSESGLDGAFRGDGRRAAGVSSPRSGSRAARSASRAPRRIRFAFGSRIGRSRARRRRRRRLCGSTARDERSRSRCDLTSTSPPRRARRPRARHQGSRRPATLRTTTLCRGSPQNGHAHGRRRNVRGRRPRVARSRMEHELARSRHGRVGLVRVASVRRKQLDVLSVADAERRRELRTAAEAWSAPTARGSRSRRTTSALTVLEHRARARPRARGLALARILAARANARHCSTQTGLLGATAGLAAVPIGTALGRSARARDQSTRVRLEHGLRGHAGSRWRGSGACGRGRVARRHLSVACAQRESGSAARCARNDAAALALRRALVLAACGRSAGERRRRIERRKAGRKSRRDGNPLPRRGRRRRVRACDGAARAFVSRRTTEATTSFGASGGISPATWRAATGRHFGFELTFFRIALSPEAQSRESFRVGRESGLDGAFRGDGRRRAAFHDRGAIRARRARTRGRRGGSVSRVGQGLVASRRCRGRRRSRSRLARETKSSRSPCSSTSTKPLVAQGDRGLDTKGPEPGNASYYYSFPRLAATGADARRRDVDGDRKRMDGSRMGNERAERRRRRLGLVRVAAVGRRELMYYRMRRRAGTRGRSAAALVAVRRLTNRLARRRAAHASDYGAASARAFAIPSRGAWRCRAKTSRSKSARISTNRRSICRCATGRAPCTPQGAGPAGPLTGRAISSSRATEPAAGARFT